MRGRRHGRWARSALSRFLRQRLLVPGDLDDAGAHARSLDAIFDLSNEQLRQSVGVETPERRRHPAIDARGDDDVHLRLLRDLHDQLYLATEVYGGHVDNRVDAIALRLRQRLDAPLDSVVAIEERIAVHAAGTGDQVLVRQGAAKL